MAELCLSFAIPMKREELPESLGSSFDGANQFLEDDEARMEETLQGSSRNGWFGSTMEAVSNKYEVTSLDFLSCKPWELEQKYFSTVIDEKRFESVIDSITSLLETFESRPQELLEIDIVGAGGWSEEDILEMFQDAEPSLYPDSDDGDDPYYLFAYLKSLLDLCLTAKRDGNVILFVQLDS